MLNCKAEDRQVDGLFINSLIVLLFLLLLCFCGSFCHLPCVRAASGSYREKEQTLQTIGHLGIGLLPR